MVNPTPYSGAAGGRNYEGSVAWYRTTFQAPAAGRYALTFQSANYRAEVWVDGRRLGSHRGSYLPFEAARASWRRARTRSSCGSTGATPAQQATEGFHRTWFNWGGLDGEVDVRLIGASDLSAPTVVDDARPGRTGDASR